MRHSRIPIVKEGYPYIFLSVLSTCVFALLEFTIPTIMLLIITILVVNFFRDPERIPPDDENLFVSPADGKVIDITKADDTIKISIFMNIFNVHVNRSPCDGVVHEIDYKPGKFLAADRDDAPIRNERNVITIIGNDFNVKVVQIAGLIARRIVCWVEKGDVLKRGDRIGLIQFGSRVDVYLPGNSEILVSLGQRVYAGETPIARRTLSNETR